MSSAVFQAQAQTNSFWNVGSGDWGTAGNWQGSVIPGIDPGNLVVFGNNISGTATVTGSTDLRMGILAIGENPSGSAFIIGSQSQTGLLVFDNGASPAILERRWGEHTYNGQTFTIQGTDSDRIDAGVLLASDLIINSSMALELRGSWDGGGNDITVNLPTAGSTPNAHKVMLNFNRTGSPAQQISNIGTFRINGGSEVRVSGAGNVFGVETLIIGDGTYGTSLVNNRVPRTVFRFERTDTTQTADIVLNQGHLISTTNAGATPQIYTGSLTVQGDSNWLQIGNAGSDRYSTFQGAFVGDANSRLFRVDGGQMRMEGDGSQFLGELLVLRDGPSDQIAAITLRGAAGTLNGSGSKLTMERGGTFWIDDSAGSNADRMADDGVVNFNGLGRSHRAQVRYTGAAAGSSETFGTFNFQSGAAGFGVVGSAGGVDITLNNLTIADNAVAQFLVYGQNQTFGGVSGANTVTMKLNNFTAGNQAGQVSNGVVVGAFGGTQIYALTGGSESEHAWMARQLMTVDGNGYLRPLEAGEYANKTIAAPTHLFTEDLTLDAVNVQATDNVRLTGGFGQDAYPLATGSQPNQTRWESVYLVKDDLTMNSLTFAQNYDAATTAAAFGDTASVDRDGNRILLDLAPGATLTLTTGMLNFSSTGTYASNSGNLDLQNFVRGGTIQAANGGDLYINNSSVWHRTSNNSLSGSYTEALIDSVLAGNDIIKTGAGAVYFTAENTFSGQLVIHQGTVVLRDHLAVQNSSGVHVDGYGAFALQGGVNIQNAPDITAGVLSGSQRVLYSNGNHNTYDGDIILKNVDSAGLSVHSARIAANTNSILTLYGDIYSDSTGMSPDSITNSSQLTSTYNSGGGVLNLRGRVMDTASGALTGTFDDNNQRNMATRFQIGGNNDLNVQVYNPWEARGRIYMEQGWLRAMPTISGTFWHSSITPISNISNAGFQMGGGGATSSQNLAVMLTKDGQVFNMPSWGVGGNSTNQTGNAMLGGENTSGTVTFGTGNGTITLNNRSAPGDPAAGSGGSVIRTYNRDLRLYAAEGGTLNLDARVTDGGNFVNSSITKIGKGNANLRGSTAGASSVEALNVMDGTLTLDFTVNNNTATSQNRVSTNNAITGINIANGGSGYAVGNVITVSGGGGSDFRARVTSVDGGGAITGIVIENQGQNFNNEISGSSIALGSAAGTFGGSGAQLQFDYGTPLKMGGGTLEMSGNAGADSVQSIAGLGVRAGASEIVVNSQAGRTATLNLGMNSTAWTRAVSNVQRDSGGTLNFVKTGAGNSVITLQGSNIPSGNILAPWATVGGAKGQATDFAEVVGTQVQAFTGYVGSYAGGNHTNVTADENFAAAATTGTVRFNDDVAHTLDLGGNLFTLDQGAMLVASGHDGSVTFQNGSITSTWQSGAGLNDLIIHQYGSASLALDAALVDDAANGRAVRLVTAGPGVVDLSGNLAGNTYTGGTVINDATVVINQENQLGATPGAVTANSLWFHGGTLRTLEDVTLSATRGITVGGGGGATFDVAADTRLTVAGNIASEANVISTYTTSEVWGDITKTGEGTMYLTNSTNNNNWSGSLDIKQGTVHFYTDADNVLGTSRNYLDGTYIRDGATLWMDTPGNDQFIYEWVTLDGGTLKTLISSGNRQLNFGGMLNVTADSVIEVAQSDNLFLNRGGGALEGSGTIYKTGKGTLALFENNVDFTGQFVVQEGSLQSRALGDAFGTADGTPGSKGQSIILGNAGLVDSTNSGEVNLALHMNAGSITTYYWEDANRTDAAYQVGASDEAAFADAYTYDMYINNDIHVVNEGIGSTSQQNKRIRIYYPNYNYQVFSINGNILAEDDLVIYMTQADRQIVSMGSRAHTNLNGNLTGNRNITLSTEVWQDVNSTQSGSTPDNDYYGIYKAFGDNSAFEGVLSIQAPGPQANGGDFRTYFRPMNAAALPQHWNLGTFGYIDMRDAFPAGVDGITVTNASGSTNYFTNNQVIINPGASLEERGFNFTFNQLTSQTYSGVIRDFVQTAEDAYDTWDRTHNPQAIAAIDETRTNIIKDGPASLTLGTANVHTGFTRVDDGMLSIGNVDALGAADATDLWTHTYVGTFYDPETNAITVNPSATGALNINGQDLRNSGTATSVTAAGDREVIHVAGGGLVDANGRKLGALINTSGTAYMPRVELHGDTHVGGYSRLEFRSLTGAAATDSAAQDQSVALQGNGHSLFKVGNNELAFINTQIENVDKIVIEEGEVRIESSSGNEVSGTKLDGVGSIDLQYLGRSSNPFQRENNLIPGMGMDYRPLSSARLEFYRQNETHNVDINMSGSTYMSGAPLVGYTADYMNLAGRQSFSDDFGIADGSSNLEARSGSTENTHVTLAGTITLAGNARLNRIRVNDGQSTGGANLGNQMTISGQITGDGGFTTVGDRRLILTGANDYTGGTIVTRDIRSQGMPEDNANYGELQTLIVSGENGSLGGTSFLQVERSGVVLFDDRGAVNANAGGRINDNAEIRLHKGTLSFKSNASSAMNETMGALKVDYGQNWIDMDSRVIDTPNGDNTVGSGGQITLNFDSYDREAGAVVHFRSMDTEKAGQVFVNSVASEHLSGAAALNQTNTQIVIGAFAGQMDDRWVWNGRAYTGSTVYLSDDKIQNRMRFALGGGLMTWDSASKELRELNSNEYFRAAQLPSNEGVEIRPSGEIFNAPTSIITRDMADSVRGTNFSVGMDPDNGVTVFTVLEMGENCNSDTLSINALHFGQEKFEYDANTNNQATYLVLRDDLTLEVESGVISFAAKGMGGTGFSGQDTNHNINLTSSINGGHLDFGSKEAILNANSFWLRTLDAGSGTGNDDNSRQSNASLIRSVMHGTGGLTKTGNSEILIDARTDMTGVLRVTQGALSFRHSGGLSGMTDVRVSGSGTFYIGSGFYDKSVKRTITAEETYQYSMTALRARDGSAYWYGDLVDNNVDDNGMRIGEVRLGVSSERSLFIDGNLYGGSKAISEDVYSTSSRFFDLNGSDRGVVDFLGQIRDTESGAVQGVVHDWETGHYLGTSYRSNGNTSGNISIVNQNQVQRLRITSADNNQNRAYNELVVNFHQQYNAAGRLYMERGIMRYEGAGTFWTQDAFDAIHQVQMGANSQNGNTGFQLGGSSATGTSAASVFLTENGQHFNIRDFSLAMNGLNSGNQSHYLLGGDNTSGTVRYGTGMYSSTADNNINASNIVFGNSANNRELTLYANEGGRVEIHSRFRDDGSGSNATIRNSYVTKAGRGTVALMGSRAGDSSMEHVTVRGGVLELSNYDVWANRRLGDVARSTTLTMGGGMLHMIGGAATNRTEDASGATSFRVGGSTIAVTSNFTGTTLLNLGLDATAFTRSAGASLHFIEQANAGTANITLRGTGSPAANALMGWAAYGTQTDDGNGLHATDFASVDGSRNIRSFAEVRAGADILDDLATASASANLKENNGFTGTLVNDVNSVLFSAAGAGTLTLDSTRTVTSGGIMVASGTTGLKTISGGTIQAGTGNDLVFHNYGSGGLQIDSIIAGNHVVFTGRKGSMTTLTNVNTYTGNTHINGGGVAISDINQLGAGNQVIINGGGLHTTADITTNRTFTVGGDGATFDVAASTTFKLDGDLVSEAHYLESLGYTDNLFFGDVIKTGDGTMTLTRQARHWQTGSQTNDDWLGTFEGAIYVQDGILRLETANDNGSGFGDGTKITTLGSNRSFLDGTYVGDGGTIQFALKRGNGGGTGNLQIFEWFTLEDGSTMHLTSASGANDLGRNDLRMEGVFNLVSGDITVQTDALMRWNLSGGHVQGAGNIIKRGNNTLELRTSSPLWTGVAKVEEGNLLLYSQGAVLGTGTGTHVLGREGWVGTDLVTMQFRSPDQSRQFDYVVDQDIRVVDNSQVKRLGLYYVFHQDTLTLKGDLHLEGNLELYSEENNDNMTFGGMPVQDQENVLTIEGSIIGNGTLHAWNNKAGTGTYPVGMDVQLSTYYVLGGDNSAWDGTLRVGYDSLAVTEAARDGTMFSYVRLGHANAFKHNQNLEFMNFGRLQLAGHDWSTTNDILAFTRGSAVAARSAKIENASETEVKVTFDTDKTGTVLAGGDFQNIAAGLSDGKAIKELGGGSAALHVEKVGVGNTVFGLGKDTGGSETKGSFSDYSGETRILQGGFYAGGDEVFSNRSRFIISDLALLSLNFDGTGHVNTIGSLQGSAGAMVNVAGSQLLFGDDNSKGADFAGTIEGSNAFLVKVGHGDQTLSGNNSGFSVSSVEVRSGALIGASNTAFGDAGNIIYVGGQDFDFQVLPDARIELLLGGEADAVQNMVQLISGGFGASGNYTGITILGTRENTGAYGFGTGSGFETSVNNMSDFFALAQGDSVFHFKGAITDANFAEGALTKIGTGTVQLHEANSYGPFAFSEAAINGGTVVRHGALEVFDDFAVASTVVELGDVNRSLGTVDVATTKSLLDDCSSFTSDATGTWTQVKAEIDGVALTGADVGKRILVKDENDNPERNGIYEIVSIDPTTGRMTLVRAADFNVESEMTYGSSVEVAGGSSQAGSAYFMASKDVVVINDENKLSPVHWVQEVVNADVSFLLGAGGIYFNNAIDVNGTNGTGKSIVGGSFENGISRFASTITSQKPAGTNAGASRKVTLTSASEDVDFDGATGTVFEWELVEGADTEFSVDVQGPGVVTITSQNQYSGATTVLNGGHLQVGAGGLGSTGAGATIVNAGGRLSGTGMVGGAGAISGVTQHSISGVIRPGDGAGSHIGTLNFTGDLQMQNGSMMEFQVGTGPTLNLADLMGWNNSYFTEGSANYNTMINEVDASHGSGLVFSGEHDQIYVEGEISMDQNSWVRLDANGYTGFEVGDIFNLIDWNTGLFAMSGSMPHFDLPDLSAINAAFKWDTSLFMEHGVVMVIVPEPSKAALLLLGLACFIGRRRRHAVK